LVFRPHMEPLVHVDDRQLAIDVQDHLQSVRQRDLLELQFRNRGRGGRRLGTSGEDRHGNRGDNQEEQHSESRHRSPILVPWWLRWDERIRTIGTKGGTAAGWTGLAGWTGWDRFN